MDEGMGGGKDVGIGLGVSANMGRSRVGVSAGRGIGTSMNRGVLRPGWSHVCRWGGVKGAGMCTCMVGGMY